MLLLWSACARPQPMEVVLRLDPATFSAAAPTRASVPIGAEARPVIVAPEVVRAGEATGVRLEGGTGRASLTLTPDAAGLPESALTVSYNTVPDALHAVPEGARQIAVSQPFQAWSGGFSITRDPADPARVVLEVESAEIASAIVNLRIDGILPVPRRLESAAFAPPRDGRLELHFGLVPRGTAGTRHAARFLAALACDGSGDDVLLDRIVQAGEPGAQVWQESVHALPARASCRLRLETIGVDPDAARGAVWAVPVITAPARAPATAIRNVVLISLDTLRADHLSGYGYPRRTSPRIDAELMARGTTFRDVSTTFPRTDVAHASLFTSLYSEAQSPAGRIDATSRVRMLAEAVGASGRTTAAFTEDAFVAGSFGFWFGFDRFVERSFVEHGRGERTFADGARFVAEHRDRPFFLFLHTYKTHDPYVSGERYRTLFTQDADRHANVYRLVPEADRAELDAFDRTIREVDDLVGGFLDELRRAGLEESTLVILLSDHGEAFGEHKVKRHGTAFHQEQLHVPLVLRGPGIPAGVSIDTPSSLVDVAPTLLELLGLAPLPNAMGASLVAGLRGGELDGDRALFFSWLGGGAPLGVRLAERKIIRANGRYEQFDLRTDPYETNRLPLDDAERTAAARLFDTHVAASTAARERTAPARPNAGIAPIPSQVEESLRALGYL